MRILILGATGMLGHRLFIELSKHHEVWGTVCGWDFPSFADRTHIIRFADAIKKPLMPDAFAASTPDVVINCIALIPKSEAVQWAMIDVNASFPQHLAYACKNHNARLIHFSTDGVFSGKRGNYTEDDTPDTTDVYGMTKRLGEISDQKHVLTLRCCPIGREIGAKKSLVEWFLAQKGTVKGYKKALFTPLSTHKIASILNDFILPNGELHGLYHLTLGDVISKYDFLCGIRGNFNHNVEIVPDDSVSINRTLSSNRLVIPLSGNFDDYITMIDEMAADNALYEGVTA